jgi:hypothetical protein
MRNAQAIPRRWMMAFRAMLTTAPPAPPPARTIPLASPRLRRKYCVGATATVYERLSVSRSDVDPAFLAYSESKTHPKPHQNTISRKKRTNVLIDDTADRATQTHKQDSQHSRPPSPESSHDLRIQDRKSAHNADGHAANEHEGCRGRNIFLEQSGLEDPVGLCCADGPPAHHRTTGQNDPAMASVGDGEIVVSGWEITVGFF